METHTSKEPAWWALQQAWICILRYVSFWWSYQDLTFLTWLKWLLWNPISYYSYCATYVQREERPEISISWRAKYNFYWHLLPSCSPPNPLADCQLAWPNQTKSVLHSGGNLVGRWALDQLLRLRYCLPRSWFLAAKLDAYSTFSYLCQHNSTHIHILLPLTLSHLSVCYDVVVGCLCAWNAGTAQ